MDNKKDFVQVKIEKGITVQKKKITKGDEITNRLEQSIVIFDYRNNYIFEIFLKAGFMYEA